MYYLGLRLKRPNLLDDSLRTCYEIKETSTCEKVHKKESKKIGVNFSCFFSFDIFQPEGFTRGENPSQLMMDYFSESPLFKDISFTWIKLPIMNVKHGLNFRRHHLEKLAMPGIFCSRWGFVQKKDIP